MYGKYSVSTWDNTYLNGIIRHLIEVTLSDISIDQWDVFLHLQLVDVLGM